MEESQITEETQAAGIYRRLAESAELRVQGKAGLYRDPELGIALAWREAKRPNAAWAERYRPGFAAAMEFLEASRQASVAEEQAREAARRRELEQVQQLAEARQLRLEQQQRAARKLRWMIAGLGRLEGHRRRHLLVEPRRIGFAGLDDVAGVVEQVPVTVLFEDGPEYPPVTVKIGELPMLQKRIQAGDVFQEIRAGLLPAVNFQLRMKIRPPAA